MLNVKNYIDDNICIAFLALILKIFKQEQHIRNSACYLGHFDMAIFKSSHLIRITFFFIGVPSGSLGVKVISVTTSHSLFIAQAHVIQEVGLERPHNGELVTILFDDDAMKMLKLQAGSFVSICPPWYESLVSDVLCVCVCLCVCVLCVCVCVCACVCVCVCVCCVCV